MNPDTARSLDWDRAESLWQAITVLEAQEILVKLKIADYPWMKREDKEELHERYHSLAYPKAHENDIAVTTEELANRLRAVLQ